MARVVVVTDEPEKYPVSTPWASGVTVHHRDDLDKIQRQLRDIEGVTVLIYDQTCAAEKRRRRKRGAYPDPDRRVFINDLVCEGCGDCSVQSNCVSVEPLETEWGLQAADQPVGLQQGFLVLEGVLSEFRHRRGSGGPTRHGGCFGWYRFEPRCGAGAGSPACQRALRDSGHRHRAAPESSLSASSWAWPRISKGKGASVLDMTGLAQKNGAVMSHVRIADDPDDLHAVAIATGGARTLLGCDIVVASAEDSLITLTQGVSRGVINADLVPTPTFVMDQGIDLSTEPMARRIREALGDDAAQFVAATTLATLLLGDAIATNLFMVGYAYQQGMIPLGADALQRAVELNGVAVCRKQARFRAWPLGGA